MKEFFQYSWGVIKQDFRAQFAPFRALRNIIRKYDH